MALQWFPDLEFPFACVYSGANLSVHGAQVEKEQQTGGRRRTLSITDYGCLIMSKLHQADTEKAHTHTDHYIGDVGLPGFMNAVCTDPPFQPF